MADSVYQSVFYRDSSAPYIRADVLERFWLSGPCERMLQAFVYKLPDFVISGWICSCENFEIFSKLWLESWVSPPWDISFLGQG